MQIPLFKSLHIFPNISWLFIFLSLVLCINPILFLSASILFLRFIHVNMGFPRWLSGKESTCQCRRCKRCGFDPWVGKIPWSRKWQPAPVFLPGNFQEGESWWIIRVHNSLSPQRVRHNWVSTHSPAQQGPSRWCIYLSQDRFQTDG